MPPAEESASLPVEAQRRLVDYRKCEGAFQSALAVPPGAGDDEQAIYGRRVGVERVIACLFREREARRVAAGVALDLDLDREAEFIDGVLRELPVKWLAPYLNLRAGHAKMCGGRVEEGRRQLAAARDGGNAIIRVAADYLIATAAPPCSPSP